MKLAIMQPYFLPYIGYFQLMQAVDYFVVYDDIQYTKKGWINRNRFLLNGEDRLFTIPLKKASDYLNVIDRQLADDYLEQVRKTLNLIKTAYNKAPYSSQIYPIIEGCFLYKTNSLFELIYHSIELVRAYLEIDTKLIISSKIAVPEGLRSSDRVKAICKAVGASNYINAIGGIELYDKADFASNGIKLEFVKSDQITYTQFNNEFVPWLSILDVLMFNSKDEVKRMLNSYKLV